MRLRLILTAGMGILLLGLPGTRADSLPFQTENPLSSMDALVEHYIHFRKEVWQLNPPIHQEGQKWVTESDEGAATSWYERAWTRWLELPAWFMAHGSGPERVSLELQSTIWPKGHRGDVWIWEHPGQQFVFVSLENPETGEWIEIARFPAPAWALNRREATQTFYDREIATRRVVWRIRSPHAPEPIEAALQPMLRSLTASGPAFRVEWVPPASQGAEPSEVRVDFGLETSPGPFAVWKHITGDLRDSEALPGNWMPIAWMRNRPSDAEWTGVFSAAGNPNPAFVRATLGSVDSDSDGLDDGYELWFFQDLSESAGGDFDQDGLTNKEEYDHNSNPTARDSDLDGRKDGDELLFGTNPTWPDHPDVQLRVTGRLIP